MHTLMCFCSIASGRCARAAPFSLLVPTARLNVQHFTFDLVSRLRLGGSRLGERRHSASLLVPFGRATWTELCDHASNAVRTFKLPCFQKNLLVIKQWWQPRTGVFCELSIQIHHLARRFLHGANIGNVPLQPPQQGWILRQFAKCIGPRVDVVMG
jgi:hypothetical protein